MEITAIRRQKRRARRLNIYIDGEYGLTLAAEVVLQAGLERGLPIDDDRLAILAGEDLALRARESALNLLGYRARSRAELAGRLIRRGFPAATVEACIERLTAAGLLDDVEFARALVQDRLRSRPKGAIGLKADLVAKGVDKAVAERVVREAFEDEPAVELNLARRAATKFRRKAGETPRAAARRFYGFLTRRGFTATTIAAYLSDQAADRGFDLGLED